VRLKQCAWAIQPEAQLHRMKKQKSSGQQTCKTNEPAYSLLHDNFLFHIQYVHVRWVPKELTDKHKHVRLDISFLHLAHYLDSEKGLSQEEIPVFTTINQK
jgi:hypothetical protein